MNFIFDIEVYPNYNLFIFKNLETKNIVAFQHNESLNELPQLENFLSQKDLVLIGFNNFRYDDTILRFLGYFNYKCSTQDIYNLSKYLIEGQINPIFRAKFSDFNNAKYYLPFLTLDLMQFQKGNLKSLGVSMGHKKLQELPFNPDKILTMVEQEAVLNYCENDIEITEKLYFEVKPKLDAREVLNKEMFPAMQRLGYKKDFRKLSDSSLAANYMVLRYCDENNLNFYNFTDYKRASSYTKIPIREILNPNISFTNKNLKDFHDKIASKIIDIEKPDLNESVIIGGKEYSFALGGLHSTDKNKIYRSDDNEIVDIDVASYYPNLIINHKIKPDFLNDSWITIYKTIVDERILAKKSGNKKRADTLKIIINSFYGNFKYKNFYAYDPKTAYSVTLNGQMYLLMLIEQLEDAGYKVISANTDGVTYLRNKPGKDLKIRKAWEEKFHLALEETLFKILIQKDVNNFCAIDTKDNFKRKGCFSKEQLGKSLKAPVIYEAVENYILNGVLPDETINTCKNIEHFLFSKKADKKFNVSFKGSRVQNINRFFVSNDESAGYLEKIEENKKIRITNERVKLENDINQDDINFVNKDFYIKEAENLLNELFADLRAEELKNLNFETLKSLEAQGFKLVPKTYKNNIKGLKINQYDEIKFDFSKYPTIAARTGKEFGIVAIDVDKPEKLPELIRGLFNNASTLKTSVAGSSRFKLFFKTSTKEIKTGNYINTFGFEILYSGTKLANITGAYNFLKNYELSGTLQELPSNIKDVILQIQKMGAPKTISEKTSKKQLINVNSDDAKTFIEEYLTSRGIAFNKNTCNKSWEIENCSSIIKYFYQIECPGKDEHTKKNGNIVQLYLMNSGKFHISCFHQSCETERKNFEQDINKAFLRHFKIDKSIIEIEEKQAKFIENCPNVDEELIEITDLKARLLNADEKSLSIIKAPTGCGKTYTLARYATEETAKGNFVTIICATKKEVEKVAGILKKAGQQDKITVAIQGLDTNHKLFKSIVITTYAYLTFKGDSAEIYKLSKHLLSERVVICDEVQAIETYSNKAIPLLGRYAKEAGSLKLLEKCLKSINKGDCSKCFITPEVAINKEKEIFLHRTLPLDKIEQKLNGKLQKVTDPNFYNTANYKQIKVKNITPNDNIFSLFPKVGDIVKFLDNVRLKIQFPYIEKAGTIKYLTQDEILSGKYEGLKIHFPQYVCTVPTLYAESKIIYDNLFNYARKIIATSATIPAQVEKNFIEKARTYNFTVNPMFRIDKVPVKYDVTCFKLESALSLNDKVKILEALSNVKIFLVEPTKRKSNNTYDNISTKTKLKGRVKYYYKDDYVSTDDSLSGKSKSINNNEDIILTYAKSGICKAVDMPDVNLVIVDCSQFLPAIALELEQTKSILDYRNYQIQKINEQLHQIIGRIFRSNLKYKQNETQIDNRPIVLLLHSLPFELQEFKPFETLLNSYQEFQEEDVLGLVASKHVECIIQSLQEGLSGQKISQKSKGQRQAAIQKAIKLGLSKLDRRTEREILTDEDIELIKKECNRNKNK